jgi:hypothetical protein
MKNALAISLILTLLCLVPTSCTQQRQPKLTPNRLITFDEEAAVNYNHTIGNNTNIRNIAASPGVCGPVGYAFLREFAQGGDISSLEDPEVPFEWIDIVNKPPRELPRYYRAKQMFVSGTLKTVSIPSDLVAALKDDIMFNHPFGPDIVMGINVDAPFKELLIDPNVPTPLQTEIDWGQIPHNPDSSRSLWFTPRGETKTDATVVPGDEVIAIGNWIMDCAHPESYHTEIHPPAFMGFARKHPLNDKTQKTVANVFMNPYMASERFNPDKSLATQFSNWDRFQSDDTVPFPRHFKRELLGIVLNPASHPYLQAHVLMLALEVDPFSFYVCAPGPQPSGTTLHVRHALVMRPGVATQVVPLDHLGCAQVVVTMNSDYQAWVPAAKETTWNWTDVSANTGGIDVLAAIKSKTGFKNNPLAISIVEKPPVIDGYDPLLYPGSWPVEGRHIWNNQPFPLVGEVHVWWDIPGTKGLKVADAVIFTEVSGETQDVQATNIGNTPLRINSITIADPGGNQGYQNFAIVTDGCTQTTLPAGGLCTIRIKFTAAGITESQGLLVIRNSVDIAPKVVALAGPGRDSPCPRPPCEPG